MVNVIIADDNKDLGISLFNYLNDTKEIRVIKYLSSGINVLEDVKKFKPELLLLDLKMPGLNGLQVLEKLEKENVETKVVIYSGEDRYILRLRDTDCVIGIINKASGMESCRNQLIRLAKELNKKSIKQQSTEFLLDLGFSTSNKGTYFLRDCIWLFLVQKRDDCVVKKLFKTVADLNKVPATYIVKNNIHTATKVAWNCGDKEKITDRLKLGATEEISPKRIITMAKYYIDID